MAGSPPHGDNRAQLQAEPGRRRTDAGAGPFRTSMRTVTLRSRLILLATVAILPLALLSGLALMALLGQQRNQVERSTLSQARALAASIDSELRQTVAALESLAVDDRVMGADAADLGAAYDLAQAVRHSRPEWRNVVLARPSGEVVFGTSDPPGSPPWRVPEMASLEEAVRARTPVVGPLGLGPRGEPGFTVRVPVVRDGQVRYVLSAILAPEVLATVLDHARIPDGWVASVFDSNNIRIARSREAARRFGTVPGPLMQAMLAEAANTGEAFGPSVTVEGEKVRTALVRIGWAHWVVALGAPSSIAEGAVWRSGLAFGAGLLLSLSLAALAAWRVSRSITQPVARLRENAVALGTGGDFAPAETSFGEIEAVSTALTEAAARRARGEAERERLLAAERSARGGAEAAQQRLLQLVAASTLLSRSLEESSTLEAISSVIVPDIADVCRIDLLDAQGALQRKLTHHADPSRIEAIASVVRSGTVSPDTPGSFPWAIATGRSYLRNFDSTDHDDIADPVFRTFARTVGMRAACVVPLVARGRTIGVMAVLQAESGRHFTPEDGALIGELAHRVALALDNVRLFAESRQALAHAEIASRTKDEFLAMLGHELRNPLAPIVTALELIRRRDDSAFPRERQIIERQVRHLSRMVDDLLDVSRIVAGKIELQPQPLDLREIVGRAMELSAPVLEKRAAAVETALPPAPVMVRGDPLRLTQVLCNLLTNAAKFTPPDMPIRIALEADGQEARITVADEGIGIPPALLARVFERFVQGEQALQRASGGLGLGLAIARSLVELHGGAIEADSDGVGSGSRFTVRLPLLSQAAAAEPAALPSATAKGPAAQRLLVVDDNTDAAELLRELLSHDGHEVRTAHSGEEALAVVSEFLPAAAVLDIGLPGMNGYELAKALRKNPRTRSIFLIALTGYGTETDRRAALAAGFDAHLPKPVEVDALLGSLHRFLDDG